MKRQLALQHQTKKRGWNNSDIQVDKLFKYLLPWLTIADNHKYAYSVCQRAKCVCVCARKRVQFNINLPVQSQQHQILHQEHHMNSQLNCNQHEVGSLNVGMTSVNLALQKTSDLLEALQGNNPKLDLPNKEATVINREYS